MFKSKQDKTENRDSMPEHPRQMLDILAKLDNINERLDQADSWAQGIDQKLATVIKQWNQSAKSTTIGFRWAEDIGRKLDILIEQWSQPVQPVKPMPQVTALNVAPDEITPDVKPPELQSNGRRKKIFYVNDPLGFIERRIDVLTAENKTATCVFLSPLLRVINANISSRRKRITPTKLVEHLRELLSENRIVAVRAVKTSDIAFRITSSEKPLPKRYSVISTKEAVKMLGLFEMWNRNG